MELNTTKEGRAKKRVKCAYCGKPALIDASSYRALVQLGRPLRFIKGTCDDCNRRKAWKA